MERNKPFTCSPAQWETWPDLQEHILALLINPAVLISPVVGAHAVCPRGPAANAFDTHSTSLKAINYSQPSKESITFNNSLFMWSGFHFFYFFLFFFTFNLALSCQSCRGIQTDEPPPTPPLTPHSPASNSTGVRMMSMMKRRIVGKKL